MYGTDLTDAGNYVLSTSDDNLLITGVRSNPDGNPQIELLKTDKNGNRLWEKTFGGAGSDAGYHITETRDAYLLLGTKESTAGDKNLFVAKIKKQ